MQTHTGYRISNFSKDIEYHSKEKCKGYAACWIIIYERTDFIVIVHITSFSRHVNEDFQIGEESPYEGIYTWWLSFLNGWYFLQIRIALGKHNFSVGTRSVVCDRMVLQQKVTKNEAI